MQISATPLKWTIPFATNDSAKVEIPATTADPTRFSLSLGSPPLTGQPPESGGVPPQLEDFNGAVNQIARFTWWAMGGGPLPYDATWSADPNVNGYANGARIATADGRGEWICVVDNNTVNPDTVGTNWVPGYNYGSLVLAGQTGGTVTLTPAQAVKRSMSIAGVLTSNLTLIVPTWLQEWTVTNTTTGAFTVTVKTAAGSGVVIPQNSAPTRVRGDGTNVTQLAENVAAATQSSQPIQLGQAIGRLLRTTTYTINGGIQQVAVDGGGFTATGAGTFTTQTLTRLCRIKVLGGGGGGGGAQGTGAGQQSAASGGAAGGYGETIIAAPLTGIVITIGAAGTGAVAGLAGGGAGGTTTFGASVTATGGAGGLAGGQVSGPNIVGTALGGNCTGATNLNAGGQPGGVAVIVATGALASGVGAASQLGGGGSPASSSAGNAARAPGAGGSGGACLQNTGAGAAGAAGGVGFIEVLEYA